MVIKNVRAFQQKQAEEEVVVVSSGAGRGRVNDGVFVGFDLGCGL